MERGGLIIGNNQLLGIHAKPAGQDAWTFCWVHVRKSRAGVSVMDQGADVQGLAALVKACNTRIPVALVVQHERLLHKSWEGTFDAVRDLQQILPNARAEQLLVEVVNGTNGRTVSVARREHVEPLLAEMADAGFRTIEVFLGTTVVDAIDALRTGRSDDGAADLTFGEDRVQHRCVPAFAACWQTWFRPLEIESAACTAAPRARKEERLRKYYEKGVVALLAALMLMLCADMVLRRSVSSGSAGLALAKAEREQHEARMVVLQASIQERERVLASMGATAGAGRLKIIDAIAASVPGPVRLKELWAAPVVGAMRQNEPVITEAHKVVVSGTCSDATALAAWVGELGRMDGVHAARLAGLQQDRDVGAPVFRIELELA